ncbi:MAG TPA: RNA 2',3'-cyclic phosphodiesterase [Synergistales bacterium]|nr:RNA 2',3'-cyclic phosphodiesterase [Synergistales bacterium]HRV71285.1 RNA 2',3'-cyclic phosphodiesterase [Thermovirgaceae bacterium]
MIRCFVCIEPGDQIIKNLGNWVAEMETVAPSLKWIRNGAFHLTLKFCGEIPFKTVCKIQNALEDGFAFKRLRPFRLELSGIGAFPGIRQPKVLWAGIEGEEDQVQRVASVVERAATAAGLDPERRPFHPHVTLARVPPTASLPIGVFSELNSRSDTWGEWTVRSVTLMRSELFPQGAKYTPISVFKFTNDQEVR